MKKKQLEYIVKVILIWMGTSGILNTLLSCAKLPVSQSLILVLGGISGTVFLILFSLPFKIRIFFMKVAAVLLGVSALAAAKNIYRGMQLVINDCLHAMEAPYGIELPRIKVAAGAEIREFYETAAMVFVAVIAALVVSLIIVYMQNMLSALLSILPGMIIFIGFAVIPDIPSFILCIAYVFGAAALGQQKNTAGAAGIVVVVSVTAAVLCLIVMPVNRFQRFPVFQKWGQVLQGDEAALADPENPALQEVRSAVNTGELGKIDSLQYQDVPVLELRTPDVGINQYIPEFYGRDYQNNRWSPSDREENLTRSLIDLADYNQALRDYIDGGTGNYAKMVQRYTQTVEYKDHRNSTYNERFVADSACYEKFSNLDTVWTDDYALYTYFEKEAAFREKVYGTYTGMDSGLKDMVKQLLGNVRVETLDQKMSYIKYVKDFLADNYIYTQSPGRVPDDTDFVKYFLLDSKEGYCTYFATAAVLMYRAAGIPARYVEGYVVERSRITAGRPVHQTVYRNSGTTRLSSYQTEYFVDVLDNQAHAWVEIYMDGYGWVTVEVTPPTASGGIFGTGSQFAPVGALTQNDPDAEQETTTAASVEEETTEPATLSEEERMLQSVWEKEQETTVPETAAAPHDTGSRFHLQWVLPVAVLAVLMTGGLRFLWLDNRRRCLLKNGSAFAAYGYLEKLLAATGYRRPDAMAYETYADYLENENEVFRKYHIKEHFSMILKLRFGDRDRKPEQDALRRFLKDLSGLRAALLAQQPVIKRMILRLLRGL